MATGQPDNSGAIHWIAGGVAILASALLAILAAGDHDRVEYKVSNLPENDPTMIGDELVVRRVTENGYIFDDNIGCTRLTGNAYLQDGRDGQTSVPGFRGPHLLKFTHWDKEPYLAVLEVQTLRDEVLGIIFDPKPGESDHCNITGQKGGTLLRRIARKAWWEEGFAPPLKGLPCSTSGRSTANGSLRSATIQGNPAHQGTARPAGR